MDEKPQFVVQSQPVVYQYMQATIPALEVEAPNPVKYNEGLNQLGSQGWLLVSSVKNEAGEYNLTLVRTGILVPAQPSNGVIPISPKITGLDGRPLS